MADLMNVQVTIRRNTPTPDGQGGSTVSWANVAIVPARISPVTAAQRVAADKLLMEATHKVYIMGDESQPLFITDQLVYGSRVFLILGMRNPSEESHHNEILVKELV